MTTENANGVPEVRDNESQDTGDDQLDVTAGDENSEDPFEAAIRARLELETEKIRREITTEQEARRRRDEQQAAAQRNAQQLSQSFATAVKVARDNWKSLQVYDREGNPVQLSDELFERAVAMPFQGHNAVVQQGLTTNLLSNLAQMALESLPEAARNEFTEKATGKPFDEWLRIYRELAAPHTEYATLTKKEREAADKAAAARAKAVTGSRPAGTPKQGNERPSNNTTPDFNSQVGLAQALVKGQISEAEYRDRRKKLEGG